MFVSLCFLAPERTVLLLRSLTAASLNQIDAGWSRGDPHPAAAAAIAPGDADGLPTVIVSVTVFTEDTKGWVLVGVRLRAERRVKRVLRHGHRVVPHFTLRSRVLPERAAKYPGHPYQLAGRGADLGSWFSLEVWATRAPDICLTAVPRSTGGARRPRRT